MSKEILFDEAVIRFTFELAQLRKEKRHGWQRIFENPESVAEHTQRAAVLGYLLAHREGFYDPNLVATMILFHDMHEARTGDADVIQRKYIKLDEKKAAADQVSDLGEAGKIILEMWNEIENANTTAGRIAKDAEILEMAFTARELIVSGNKEAQSWIDGIRIRLQTKSGRELLETINSSDPGDWWKEL